MYKPNEVVLKKAKRLFNVVVGTILAVVLLYLTFYVTTHTIERQRVNAEIKADTICPPLLSISRSARDTLIVMKAEPVCAMFVLDSLK